MHPLKAIFNGQRVNQYGGYTGMQPRTTLP